MERADFVTSLSAGCLGLWALSRPNGSSFGAVRPIRGKFVEIHSQHPQSIGKLQQKLVYP